MTVSDLIDDLRKNYDESMEVYIDSSFQEHSPRNPRPIDSIITKETFIKYDKDHKKIYEERVVIRSG